MFQVQDLLTPRVAALVMRDAAAVVPDLQVRRIELGLDPRARARGHRVGVGLDQDTAAAVNHGVRQFIGVGTPPTEDGSADLEHVLEAARNIGRHMSGYKVVIDKSTVPVGTADRVRGIVAEELSKRGVTHEFAVVSNPEFLKEGAAVRDFMNPERIILGCDSDRAESILRKLYAPFSRNHDRILRMRPREAEMTKYASNALLAAKISFMNEIAEFCDELGVDIEKVRAGVGADSRIGYSFLYAGCGYGGSCFPKDVKALIHTAKNIKTDAGILEAIERRNERQKRKLYDKIVARFGADLKAHTFAVWGLSFKPDTDDVREALAHLLAAEVGEETEAAEVHDGGGAG